MLRYARFLFLSLTSVAMSAPAEDFRVTAQILSISESKERQLYLYDGEKMLQIRDHSNPRVPCQCGDIVLADGFVTENIQHNPLLIARELQVLGSKPLPPTSETDARQLAHGTLTNHIVSIRGVLASAARDSTDAQWNWLVIKTRDGKAIAAATENEPPRPSAITNRRRGVHQRLRQHHAGRS